MELRTNHTHETYGDKSAGRLVDDLVEKLSNRILKVSSVHHADLDDAVLGKSGHLTVPKGIASRPFALNFPVHKIAAPHDSMKPRSPHRLQFHGNALSRNVQNERLDFPEPKRDFDQLLKLHNFVGKMVNGLPWWWKHIWDLPFAQRGNPGEALTPGDTMHVFRTNIEQMYGKFPSVDGAPLAEGTAVLDGLTDGTMFLGLFDYYKKYGSIYKLCFGPKSFMVISDPVIMKHILQENSNGYDKGMLSEILKPIMGNGLIPADAETWRIRRRAIVPGFHQKFIQRMVTLFGEQTVKATKVLDQAAATGTIVDVEERLGSLALDIIGRAVFDYDFDSTNNESPVVKAAISTLKEAEHRLMMPLPYWDIPFATDIIPRQVEFKKNMKVLNDRLDMCINTALADRKQEDVEALQEQDYSSMENPSLLKFMVDMRDEDVTSTQLRDDLMTMLIAGHETTASALTWAIFELAQQPELLSRLQAELDEHLPSADAIPTMETLRNLTLTRLCIAESLRMYPEPPLLIRRAVEEDTLPRGLGETEVKLLRGKDLFLSVYNIHRSPLYWDNPDTFDPDRFLRKKESTIKGWAGFDPEKWANRWYPTEAAADWAYLPFGGGKRKCVGDQFAMLEATVALACLVRRYEFEFAGPTATPEEVGMATGATIHTKNGLWMKVTRRGTTNRRTGNKHVQSTTSENSSPQQVPKVARVFSR
jgi:cytochrome P450